MAHFIMDTNETTRFPVQSIFLYRSAAPVRLPTPPPRPSICSTVSLTRLPHPCQTSAATPNRQLIPTHGPKNSAFTPKHREGSFEHTSRLCHSLLKPPKGSRRHRMRPGSSQALDHPLAQVSHLSCQPLPPEGSTSPSRRVGGPPHWLCPPPGMPRSRLLAPSPAPSALPLYTQGPPNRPGLGD